MTQFSAAQQAAVASLQNRVEYCKEQGDRGYKSDRAGNSGSNADGGSLEGPKEKSEKKKQDV